jgi:23S rRNA pseudouridine1911/1915/1917 synthase
MNATTNRYHLRTRVPPALRDRPMIDFLSARFPYHARDIWKDRIARGRVRLNGETITAETVVHQDDTVEYVVELVEPEVDFSYTIVHDDSDLLVVSKSGNIPVHASGQFIGHTLIARLRRDIGESLDLAHRLDRETSGLVVLVRNTDAARAMSRAFAEGEVRRTYVAVVRGCPDEMAFEISAPLGRIGKRHPFPRSIVDRRDGKPARTLVRVVERLRSFAVLEANPLTGRTHQVRAHLEYAGHPVVGDKAYGVPARLLPKMVDHPGATEVVNHLLLPRHALHCARLAFAHPRTHERLELSAPLPQDMACFIRIHR